MKSELYKHNSIIGAASKITLQEERYINICLGRVYKKELLDSSIWYGLDIDYYAERSGVSKRNSYEELRRIASSLRTSSVKLPLADGSFIETSWIKAILFNPSEFTLAVKWNEALIPFISGFTEGNYTVIDASAAKLSSINGYKLYEIVKKNVFKKNFTISVEELQKELGVSYSTYGHFKEAVLKPCGVDILSKTDLRYETKEIKTGRKVTSLCFFELCLIDFSFIDTEIENKAKQIRLYGKELEC